MEERARYRVVFMRAGNTIWKGTVWAHGSADALRMAEDKALGLGLDLTGCLLHVCLAR